MLRSIALCTIFLLLVIGSSAIAAEGCVTSACHADTVKVTFAHAPASEDCQLCHEQVRSGHPQQEQDFRLVATGAELCYRCHDNPMTAPRYHEPVKLGRCTYCHNPHGSDNPGLLVLPVNSLCLKCHTSKRQLATMSNLHPVLVEEGCTACHDPHSAQYVDLLSKQGIDFCADCHAAVAARAREARVKHEALAGGCVACHDPHGTGNPRLLLVAEKVFCVSCHTEMAEVIAAASSQHQPVAEGRCWVCHDPHGADVFSLLKTSYPEPFYAGYDEELFQLCFRCHDSRAFEYERTSELTGFRNGDRNLHFLHVNKATKGRVCKTCHGVHGADQGKLVTSKIAGFGRWEIPIYWQAQANGATCTVGCHKPKTYDRYEKFPND